MLPSQEGTLPPHLCTGESEVRVKLQPSQEEKPGSDPHALADGVLLPFLGTNAICKHLPASRPSREAQRPAPGSQTHACRFRAVPKEESSLDGIRGSPYTDG